MPSYHDEPFDDEPELAGYQPHADKPLRSPQLVRLMRIVVVIGLVGLVLPGILVTVSTANATAQRSCAIYAAALAPDTIAHDARFEMFSAAGLGWNCYATSFGGKETLLAAMGVIPGGARLPEGPVSQT